MDFRHLRTFVTVVEQGTVSKAALHLHVAQPALSRHINDLESELGLKLFDRVGRRLLLTGEGAQLLETCRSLLGNLSSLGEQAQQLRSGDTGVLKVAASPGQIETVFSAFLHGYAQRYPNVQVKLIEAVGVEALALLGRGEAQLCTALVQPEELAERGFDFYALPSLELFAACHPKRQLDHGAAIEIDRLALYPLLLLDSGFFARKTFDAACSLAGLKPNIIFESKSPHTLLALAEAGHGVAILPSVRTHRYKLRMVRITYKSMPLRFPLVVVWDERRVLPRFAKDFCELLTEFMCKIDRHGQKSGTKVEVATMRPHGRNRPCAAASIRKRPPAPKPTSRT
jgi:DNA-binding transcriptional LysR family regulator